VAGLLQRRRGPSAMAFQPFLAASDLCLSTFSCGFGPFSQLSRWLSMTFSLHRDLSTFSLGRDRREADGVNLNFARNFPSDIEVLKTAKAIRSITINDYSWGFDYSAIHSLSTLEDLSVYTTDKRGIDYARFPHLRSTALFWRPNAESLFKCKSLERLFLGKFMDVDLSRLSGLVNLKYLRLNTGAMQNLHGIEHLVRLEQLLLMQATKLRSIQGVASLPSLRLLRILNCRSIADIHRVADLHRATDVHIAGATPKP